MTETTAKAPEAKVRTMSLPVKLTEGELSLRAQELASSESVLSEAEVRLEQFIEDAKSTKKVIESEISGARHSVGRLARIVLDRKEHREVPIMEEPDYEAGAVNTIRTDTNEVVATRGMTAEERQRSLFQNAAKKRPS
jgi:hypothetical protein